MFRVEVLERRDDDGFVLDGEQVARWLRDTQPDDRPDQMDGASSGRRRSDARGRPTPSARLRRGLMWTALLTVLGIGVVAAVPDLRSVISQLRRAAPGWLALAGGFELLSCLGFVLTFRLVFALLAHRLVNQIAWTEMAFGSVVPLGGAGGMTVGAWILHEKGVPLSLVAMRSGVLFLLRSAINVIVLVLAGVGLATGLLPGSHPLVLGLIPSAIGTVVFVVFATADLWTARAPRRGSVGRWLDATTDTVRMTREVLLSRDWRLAGALGYLLFDIAVLWACFRALGADPPIGAIAMGYQIGYLANLVPVPGSIGALEGGLAGALVLYGTPPGRTLAAVLVYHAIALWLPTIGGTIAFLTVRQTLHEPLPSVVLARIRRFSSRSREGRATPPLAS